jgi:2-dehydropantoate 2-reductase
VRILTVGAGATGGYFGARLIQAGRDVTFLLRPSRAAAVRTEGLWLRDLATETALRPKVLTADQLDSPFDLVLLSTKHDALGAAMEDMAPAVGPSTLVVPFLNGIGHLDRLNDRFGPSAVLGGVVEVATTLNEKGAIVQLAPGASLAVGRQPKSTGGDLTDVAAVLEVDGFDFSISEDIVGDMWSKWTFIATLGALNCVMRGTVGEIVAVRHGRDIGPAILAEAAAAADACGFAVPSGDIAATESAVTQQNSQLTSSMYRDLMAGRLTESEPILEDLVRRAGAHGVKTPYLALAAAHLAVYNRRIAADDHKVPS